MTSFVYPSEADLVQAMNGVPTTNQWDVVCSYNAAQLNAFLSAQYAANRLASEVKLTTQRKDPLSGADYTIDYDVHFASPVLSFLAGRSGYAKLDMPIMSGSYKVTPAGATQPTLTKDIPANTYTVSTIVPLASIEGTSGAVTEQGKIVVLGDGSAAQQSIILHFQTTGGTVFSIAPAPSPSDTDALVTYFLPVLAQYFQTEVSEIDYALAAVNNRTPTAGDTVLTPKSFAFASVGGDDVGVLSLYIQTAESGNPPGNPAPSFQPGDGQMLPIPANYTASIILSNALILNGFLTPQLQASGFSVSFDTPSDGISAELKSSAAVINPGKDDNWFFGDTEYKGLDITLNDHPLNLVFKQGNVSLHWKATTSSEWSQTSVAPGGPAGGSTSYHYGVVDLTLTVNTAPIPLNAGNDDISIADVTLQRSDFTVTTRGEDCAWYQTAFAGCMETVPQYYSSDMELQIPPIAVSLHGLDFFATTNVLAPGQQVIKIDAGAGTQTPHDLLLVGNVTTGS
jgi:hypothetical protein